MRGPVRWLTVVAALIGISMPTLLFSQTESPAGQPVSPGTSTDTKSASRETSAAKRVRPGIERLLNEKLDLVRGKRIGLITNQSGVDSRLNSTVDLLYGSKDVKLLRLFAPEHGLRGDQPAGREVRFYRDRETGLPVYSLYGAQKRPTKKMLEGLDALLFDIQDVGASQYTYISTMAQAMEGCAHERLRFIVLDRPNPLGGLKVEGPLAEPAYRSFIGLYPIPIVHGMTIGELARMFNSEFGIRARLEVVEMEGWQRKMLFPETGLPWVPTSPNIPTYESAFLYAGMGIIGESGLASVGVGTALPFQIAGAPWADACKLARHLSEQGIPGVAFRPYWFTPFWGKFKGDQVQGVQIHVTDPHTAMPLETAVGVACAMRDLYPVRFKELFTENEWKVFDRACKTHRIRKGLVNGRSVKDIRDDWQRDVAQFQKTREKSLLYR